MEREVGVRREVKPDKQERGVLPAGTRLRNYELVSVLGQGGFGITYRARDTTLDRDVAIKEYLPISLALRAEGTTVVPRSTDHAGEFVWGRNRFLDEARTLAQLGRAPAIVRVYDFLEAHGTAYMIMALAEGETLHQRLASGQRLLPAAIDRLLQPLLDGLEEVHAAGFLHRDIKPANIILDARGDPTLIDFGAARAATAGRTAAMTAIFTPGYAAAEQFTSARQGPWTDIYGLSATLYHAIVGKVPPGAVERMVEDTCEPLSVLAPEDFRPSLLRGIDAGLAVRAKDRPQDIREWRALFEGAVVSTVVDPPTAIMRRPDDDASPPTRRAPESSNEASGGAARSDRWKRLAMWGAAAAGIVMLAGAVFFTRPIFFGTAVQTMTADELERALDERRKADAAAAEKKKLEEEAARQAQADADAKRKADEALAAAQLQRQQAEQELAKLKAEIEARRKAEEAQREQAAAAAQRALEEAARKNEAEAAIAALRRAEEEAKAQAAADAAAKQKADEEAQRRAEAEAAALRQAEEEARQKAAAEAEAKRQADEVLAKAQAERQRAEEEVARQKAELDAKQQAEAAAKAAAEAKVAAAAKAKAEADAKAKAEADAKAEAAAKAKAEADAKAKADAEAAAQKKAAEAAEGALKLETADRQRLQVALTALGFATNGTDGMFGPRSREMIAAWQKARDQSPTGFLTAAQQQALLKEGDPAVSKYEEERKKLEDDRKKAEEDARKKADEEAKKKADEDAKRKADEAAKASAAAPATPPSAGGAAPASVVSAAPSAAISGTYSGAFDLPNAQSSGGRPICYVTLKVVNGRGTGTVLIRGGANPAGYVAGALTVDISPAGAVTGQGDAQVPNQGGRIQLSLKGQADDKRIRLAISGWTRAAIDVSLSRAP